MIVYSTHCPKCNVLLKRLDSLNKEYELVENFDEITKVAEEYGAMEAPFIIDKDIYYNFSEAMKALTEGRL